jgi:Ni/Co efflux regulator RcnB
MKRSALIIATAAAAAFGPLALDLAQAQGRHEGRAPREQRQERGWERQERGPRRGGYDDGPRRGQRYGDGGYERGYPAPYPRAPGVRPGGYLSPAYRAPQVEDYRRYRLRPPPNGYRWIRMGDGFALVSPDDQIFDVIR